MGYWLELKAWLLKDPAKLLRHVVLFACLIVVIVQLTECFIKLRYPPISTHSYYRLNETIEMPAVTICREPAYKEDILSDISQNACPHPKYVTCWWDYPYDEVPLTEFFTNGTFDFEETFQQYGLDGERDNVEISSSLHFNMGLCHTLRPKVTLRRAAKTTGYSLMLKHHVIEDEDTSKLYATEPGWHLFIHDYRENFTEINMKGSGRVEYIFAEMNEQIEIKLEGKYFSMVETDLLACDRSRGYSDLKVGTATARQRKSNSRSTFKSYNSFFFAGKCGETCVWNVLAQKSNCSGPWMNSDAMEGIELPPPCDSYSEMKNLTTEYGFVYRNEDDYGCECAVPCQTRLYSTYIQNRKEFLQPEVTRTQVYIYYTTKIVSVVEERPSYDSTQFIADIGGSLGFLLGLSVLGIIGMLEHMTLFLCGGMIKRMHKKDEKHRKVPEDQQSHASDETVDVATIYKTKSTNKSI